MNITIRVINTGEVLDTFTKVALENTITSAFLSEDGSKTIPISLPITERNALIFGFSRRIDRAQKGNMEIDVIVKKGSYSRRGKLYLGSSSLKDSSFSATIAYNEAILYELQSKLKLNQLPTLPVEEGNGKPDFFIDKMKHLLTVDDVNIPLTAFKVYLKNAGSYKAKPYPEAEHEQTYDIPFILNDYTHEFGKVELLVKDSLTIEHDGKPLDITAAKGIGLSPFVHVWYVIERIAEHFGYEMGRNEMKEDPQLIRATLLNNTADAIVGGFLDYKQLMPDYTISEFFQYLWARHGAKVMIDGNTNTLSVKLLKNAINEKNLSLLPISGSIHIDHSKPKQLKLSANRNLQDSKTETDTYEEFLAKYNNTIGNYTEDFYEDGIGGVVLDPPRGLYYHAPMSEFDEEGKTNEIKSISSIHFDWDKKDEGLEYIEISSPDECLTAAWADGDGRYPYYGVDFALLNSRMEIDRQVESRDTPNKLAVCWDMGQMYYGDGIKERNNQGYKIGSIFPYVPSSGRLNRYYIDEQGNAYKYAMMWVGKDGCFEHFWKDYDAVLRHSADVVKGKIDLPIYEMSALDISKPYIVQNQKILLQDYSYIIGNVDVDKQEFNGITLGLYQPYDLAKEQSHPQPDPIRYKWVLENDKQTKLDKDLQYEIDHFENTDLQKLISCERIEENDKEPPTLHGLAYYPPTKKDVDEGRTIGYSKHKVEVLYLIKYEKWDFDQEYPGWVEKEDRKRKDVEYNAYLIAKKRNE